MPRRRFLVMTIVLALAALAASAATAAPRPEFAQGYRIGYRTAEALRQSGREPTYQGFVRYSRAQFRRHGEDNRDFVRGYMLGGLDCYEGKKFGASLK